MPDRTKPADSVQDGCQRVLKCALREMPPQVGFEPTTLRLTAAAPTGDQHRRRAMRIRRIIDFRQFSSRPSIFVNHSRSPSFERVTSQPTSQLNWASVETV